MAESMARQVAWTRAAAGDLQAIVTYIALDGPESARSVLTKLRQRAENLATAPERGRIVPELARFGIRSYREVAVRPYRLMYRIEERRIIVIAVYDGRRDLDEVLLERLVRP